MGHFNKYLVTMRENKLYSQGALAKALNVHRNTQANYEDDRDPPLDYLLNFCKELDISFVQILSKRIESSSITDGAKRKALEELSYQGSKFKSSDSQNNKNTSDNTLEKLLSNQSSNFQSYEVSNDLFKPMPKGSIVLCDTLDKEITSNCLYGFSNPLTNEFTIARVELTGSSLVMCFDNPAQENRVFMLEGGEMERNIILQTLGLVGKAKFSLGKL
ncbi:hypothetical protein CJF42_11760 [Pseudoalteromonas sp. NBT06-2]|uniref:helix-turn-helix domain-containing protein n=1 Tax=Pseudoalteromonas sp. NBT06-2 TaxID=2025950 RepID=UPI000BA707B0|nr:helix-turn-helix transcriptional regulator [Pseudoalteromonas sp. NBT06-2]PAJ74157.1 hypothetical protein CJF42_11760 [Pseudoalteromonas sp. NBT06-2]